VKRLDLLAVSDMCVDLLLSGNVRPRFGQVEQLIGAYHLELGGSANIFAAQMAKLGAQAGVIGALGADPLGTFALGRLQSLGLDTGRVWVDARLQTGLGVALIEGNDRAILTFPGSLSAVGPDRLPDLASEPCRHWHIASYFLLDRLRSVWRAWLAACRRAGITTSLDPNWDPENRWRGVRELLPEVDVFLPNRAEILAIAGGTDPRMAALELSAAGPLVVVKCGADGVLAAWRGQVWEAPPLPLQSPVVDAVGAGDNFDAGFLCGRLSGWSVPNAIALGQRCAVASLASSGGFAGQLEEPSFRPAGVCWKTP